MKAIPSVLKGKPNRKYFRFAMSNDEFAEADDSSIGYCIGCGEERDGCEPDARRYPCEACGKRLVYGTQELLIMGVIDIAEPSE